MANQSRNGRPCFSHPSEEVFADILDFYGIEWQYEPRTFPLEWDEQGNMVEAMSPDFYLPEEDQYIELTTLRPQLIGAKHRKLRRLHELYPQINIKLLGRRDLRQLMIKYGVDQEAERIRGQEPQRSSP
jgi:hypothetical protein